MSKGRDKMMVEERPSRDFIGLDSEGFEHPDPTPVEVPTRLRMPGNQVQRMREMIRRELSLRAEGDGFESFDDADDFEMEEVEWVSPYELQFEPESSRVAVRRNGAAKGDENGGRSGKVDDAGAEGSGVGSRVGPEGAGTSGGKAGEPAGSKGGSGKSDSGRESASGKGADG